MAVQADWEQTASTSSPASDETADDGAWVPRLEAARILSISERTLDRRLTRHLLPRRQRLDGTVEVFLTAEQLTRQRPDEDASAKALVLMERFNAALAQQTQPLVETIRSQAEELGRLREQNAALTRQLAAQQATPANDQSATRPAWWAAFWPWRRGATEA
jgi:hypothetical protein